MRFKKIYVEITNVCNLSCAFCKKTLRDPRFMSVEEFSAVIGKIAPFTAHVCLHVMGEPLLHDDLSEILDICRSRGMGVNITTNGTLISTKAEILLNGDVRQINFSLHAMTDTGRDFDRYMNDILAFSVLASKKTYINLRLWNYRENAAISDGTGRALAMVDEFFSCGGIAFQKKKGHGVRVYDNIYLQIHEAFDWPALGAKPVFGSGRCYALRDHVGILADGTVVPCCLDAEGDLALGNVFDGELGDIINSARALRIFEGFAKRRVVAGLCKTCGFAAAL